MSAVKTELKPTLWRTARVLANKDRLHLLHLVSHSKGARGVTELAALANLPVPTASIYLRALNARGLISVVRAGPFVYYGTSSDRSLPVSISIQKSFARLFALERLPNDWTDRLMPLLRAYSHPCRESIVRILNSFQPIRYQELYRRSGLGRMSFLRHLDHLTDAGIVVRNSDGAYSLAKPRNSLASAFLEATRS